MYEISKANDISILHLYGDLSLLEMELLSKTIQSFKNCRHYKIVVDLARVDYLHFRLAHKLVEEAEQLRAVDGDLKLVGSNGQARETLKFAGADQRLEDFSNLSEAVLSFLNKTYDTGSLN